MPAFQSSSVNTGVSLAGSRACAEPLSQPPRRSVGALQRPTAPRASQCLPFNSIYHLHVAAGVCASASYSHPVAAEAGYGHHAASDGAPLQRDSRRRTARSAAVQFQGLWPRPTCPRSVAAYAGSEGRKSNQWGGPSTSSSGGGFLRAAVGIDLGTTTSAVAVASLDGRPMVVEDEAGRAVIPSVVFVRQDGSVLVGDEAVAAAEADPANAFYGIKRLMGRRYSEALLEADQEVAAEAAAGRDVAEAAAATTTLHLQQQQQQQQDLQRRRRLRSYSLTEGRGGRVEVVCPALGRNMTPPEVSSHLIRHLVSRARTFLERQEREKSLRQRQRGSEGISGELNRAPSEDGGSSGTVQVLDAVITVPAHFSPVQRQATAEAARAAGLQRVTLLQEPIAAAIAYGFGSPHVPYDVLMVFDLGGGTLDVTIVEAFDGIMEVLSTSGDNYLGGDDFTAAIAAWLAEQYQQWQQQQQHEHQHQHQDKHQPRGRQGQPEQQQHHHHSHGLAQQGAPITTTTTTTTTTATTTTATASSSSTSGSSSTTATTTVFTASPSALDPLTLLRAAEAAKLALSEAVAAARSGISAAADRQDSDATGSSSRDGSSGRGGSSSSTAGPVYVTVRLPAAPVGSSGAVGSATAAVEGVATGCSREGSPQPPQQVELRLSHDTFGTLVRPLMRRVWWPLERVALATRTQLGGRLAPDLNPRFGSTDPRVSGNGDAAAVPAPKAAASGAGVCSSSISNSLASGSSAWDLGSEGPGRREGAAPWEFSIFPPPPLSAAAAGGGGGGKYVAPPRRLTGLVLVGAGTRLPVIRDYITEVTGLAIRPGVDPETAVALGAALHAGLMVGSVAGGIEMNDGGYVAAQHGRTSGFQVAASSAAAVVVGGGRGSTGMLGEEVEEEGSLVWEP